MTASMLLESREGCERIQIQRSSENVVVAIMASAGGFVKHKNHSNQKSFFGVNWGA